MQNALPFTAKSAAQTQARSRRRPIPLLRTCLAGFRHHSAERLMPLLKPGQQVELVRETDNPHDTQAVAVVWRGKKLGYLPKEENLMPALLLDRSRRVFAWVDALRPEADCNERVRLEIAMEKAA